MKIGRSWTELLSAQCVSSIGQIIRSVCVSVSHQSVSQSVSEWILGPPPYLGNGWR